MAGPLPPTITAAAAPPPQSFTPISAASLLASIERAHTTPSLHPDSAISTTQEGYLALLPTQQTTPGSLLSLPIPRGCIIGISAPASLGAIARVLGLELLIRNLVARGPKNDGKGGSGARAMIVDCTGDFSGVGLQDLMRVALGECDGERGRVGEVLQRVGVTRVFDFEGVWEVLGEVRGLRGTGSGREEEEESKVAGLDRLEERREAEMDEGQVQTTRAPIEHAEDVRPDILLLPLPPSFIATLFSTTDRITAHKTLACLSRTLTALSRGPSRFTTIILNSTVNAPYGEGVSVFSDITHKPALGAVYEGFVDLSLMVSQLPARRSDAEGVFGGDEGGERGEVRFTNVVEVLRDDLVDVERWKEEEGEVTHADREGIDEEGNGDSGERNEGRERGADDGRGKRERVGREGMWAAFDVVREERKVMIREAKF